MTLITLIYHDVLADDGKDDSGFAGADAASYKLSAKRFARHLNIIGDVLGASRPLLVNSAGEFPAQAARKLLLTFDDGGASAGRRRL